MKSFSEFIMESNNIIPYDDAKRLRDLNLITEFDYLRSAKEAGLLNKFLISAKVEHNYLGSPDQREELINDLTYELDDAIDGVILEPGSVYIDEWTDDADMFYPDVIAQFDVYTELDESQLEELLNNALPAMLDVNTMRIQKHES